MVLVSTKLVCRRCRIDFFKRGEPSCLGCGCGVSVSFVMSMYDIFVVG